MAKMKTYNVLFVCTGNSARSILAEALLNAHGQDRFVGHSAGSQPTGYVNPFALRLLQSKGLDTDRCRSKSWDEFGAKDAPTMDFIFTVCDSAAKEVCPAWPGKPATAHWGVPDPAAVQGSDAVKEAAFVAAYNKLKTRVEMFLTLPVEDLDLLSLERQLQTIGDT